MQARACASLLMAEGQPQARRYPLAYLWNETRFARRRVNNRAATQAILMQAVVVSALEGGKHLQNAIRRLDRGDS